MLGHVATVTIAGEPAPGGVTTPHEGHFATFSCVFGLVTIEVGGSGLVGTITAPAVGVPSNEATLSFETENGEQVHMDADIGDGLETFALVANVNGTPEPTGVDETYTTSFVNEGEGTLTE